MRLAAQMLGGFYPAHPNAVAHAMTHLSAPANRPFAILDPCAGEGAAIQQIATVLGCSSSQTFAIELDDNRSNALQATLPEGHVLAPASFFGCRASLNSFSFIWLNPPFDHAYGGHRVEDQFLRTATDWLMPGGVIAFVCPEDVVNEYSDARQHFATYFQNCKIVPFPEAYRPYKEVIVFAHKRGRLDGERKCDAPRPWDSVQAPEGFLYHLPPSVGPRIFQKVEPTESELQQMLAQSPLRAHRTAPREIALPSPPLALGIGHIALLLAGGQLDGVVQPDGKLPHVVRGTSRKREFVSDVTETDNDDGSTTTKTTISQRIDLVVRTVDSSGTIRTFTDSDAKEG